MLPNILFTDAASIYMFLGACIVFVLLIWAFVAWLFTWLVGVDEDDETPATYLDWPEPDGPPLED